MLPSYLARWDSSSSSSSSSTSSTRFYMSVKEGMKVGPDKVVSECLASILLNSTNLMRIDLEGANLLAPALVTALEAGGVLTSLLTSHLPPHLSLFTPPSTPLPPHPSLPTSHLPPPHPSPQCCLSVR